MDLAGVHVVLYWLQRSLTRTGSEQDPDPAIQDTLPDFQLSFTENGVSLPSDPGDTAHLLRWQKQRWPETQALLLRLPFQQYGSEGFSPRAESTQVQLTALCQSLSPCDWLR